MEFNINTFFQYYTELLNFGPEFFYFISLIFLLLFFVYFNEKKLLKNYFFNYKNGFFYFFFLINFISLFLLISSPTFFTGVYSSVLINNIVVLTKIFILILYFFLLLFTYFYYVQSNIRTFEMIYLMSTSLVGLLFLLNAGHFISLYLAIEIFNLSIYVAIGLRKNKKTSIESGLKFLIIGSISSAFLLQAIALLYFKTGTLNFQNLELFFYNESLDLYYIIIMVFIILSFSIKMVLAPFHQWAIDVYDGAPFFITFYLALIPKIAYIVVLLKIFYSIFLNFFFLWSYFFIFLIIISSAVGILGALQQTKIKRFLVFSMISNSSFLLIPFLFLGDNIQNLSLLFFFIFVYSINTIGIFFLFGSLYDWSQNIFLKNIKDLVNLDSRNKVKAFCFAVILASLAGLPPFAGFYPKIYMLLLLYNNNYVVLFYFMLIFNSIGIFYYIRLIKLIYFTKNKNYIINFKPFNKEFQYINWIIIFTVLFNIIFFFFMNDILLFCNEIIFFYNNNISSSTVNILLFDNLFQVYSDFFKLLKDIWNFIINLIKNVK